ncbi:MAG: DUF3857 domain-containing protein [Bacteroidota bacterium]
MAVSQTVSDFRGYADKYKDKDIVYLNLKTEVMVDIEKTGLKIEETKYEDIYYNNFKAGAYSEKDVETSHFIKMKEIEASTLMPDGDKFKEVKVKEFKTKEVIDEEIFYQDLFSTSFIFPSLRQGAITKLKFTLNINEPRFFPFEVTQKFFPIENLEFVINTDKNVNFDIKYFNIDTSKINFSIVEKGNRIIYSWKIKDIPSYKTETESRGYLCFLPQIVPYIKSYKIKDKEVSVFNGVDELFKWYNGNLSKIDHKQTDEMISTVNTLIKDCKSDNEKVAAIYKWVQSNIKYVANEYGSGGFVPRNPYQIFEKRYGDCKDMATIIVELLNIAKITAYYTWIGTRELPYRYKEIPTSMVDNHMIATYIENGKYYYLDATNPYIPLGLPSSFIQGKEAMIRLNEEKYEIKEVPEIQAEVNSYSDSVNITIDQGKVVGKGLLKLNGYYFSGMKQTSERIKDSEDKSKFMKSYLEKGNNKYILDNYKINTSNSDININYEFNIADYVKANDNELYINLNLSQPFGDYEYFKDDRKLDYEFSFKSLLQISTVFAIPESYELSYLPKNVKFENPNFTYYINYEVKDKQIIYHYAFKTDTMLLTPELFSIWNKMLKQIRSDYKEAIVLKKKI